MECQSIVCERKNGLSGGESLNRWNIGIPKHLAACPNSETSSCTGYRKAEPGSAAPVEGGSAILETCTPTNGTVESRSKVEILLLFVTTFWNLFAVQAASPGRADDVCGASTTKVTHGLDRPSDLNYISK